MDKITSTTRKAVYKKKYGKREPGNTNGPKRSHLKDLFIERFPYNGTIQSTCEELKIHRSVVYHWLEDPKYQERYKEAALHLVERYEKSAQHRGVEGVDKFVLWQGSPVVNPEHECQLKPEDGSILDTVTLSKKCKTHFLKVKEYSDNCLAMLLAAKDPEHYGRRADSARFQIDVRIVQDISSELIAILNRRLPQCCPNCKTDMSNTRSEIADELERLSLSMDSKAAKAANP